MNDALIGAARATEARLKTLFDQIHGQTECHLFGTIDHSIVLDQVRLITLRGGKRIRAAVLVNSAALFDNNAPENPAVIDAAAALELLQTYFLIHDDIMDQDDIRRGGLSAHAAFSKQTGDQHMGISLGILAGDLAMALAQMLISGLDVDLSCRDRVSKLFAQMHLDVVHGQILDILGTASALEVSSRKTASYTTVGPMAIGACLAGACQDEILDLTSLGRDLGVAFQLMDDVLGIFGNSKQTGKPMATDLRLGKKTFLLEQALELSDESQLGAIKKVLGDADASDENLRLACRAFIDCGAKKACDDKVADLIENFIQGLEIGDYKQNGKAFLIDLARFVAKREG